MGSVWLYTIGGLDYWTDHFLLDAGKPQNKNEAPQSVTCIHVTSLYRIDVFGYTRSVEELYLMSLGGGGGDFDEVFEGKLPSLQGIKVIL